MTAPAVIEAPPRPPARSRRRLGPANAMHPSQSSHGGRLTLEHRLDGVWEGLRAGGVAECPMCAGAMGYSAPDVGEACCADCGTALR